jgi:ribosomal-protein-alanine N-acetyltransferase
MAKKHVNMQINIRPMQSDDLELVHLIDKISFSMPWSPRAYHYELNENDSSYLWVAESSTAQEVKRIIGFIVLWLILDEAHIATIAVHPDYRKRGIAQELLRTALTTAIHKGAKSATLEVRANNEIAKKLYRRFRFEIVGHRPRYYRDNNEDATLMTVDTLGPDYLDWLKTVDWRQLSNAKTKTGFRQA